MGLHPHRVRALFSTKGGKPVEELLKEYQESARLVERRISQIRSTLHTLDKGEFIEARKRLEVLEEEYYDLAYAMRGIRWYLEPKGPP